MTEPTTTSTDPSPAEEKTYTTGQLAKLYRVSDQSIRNWSDRGIIPQPDRTPTKHRRYTQKHIDALEAYLYPEGRDAVNAANG